MPDKKKCSVAGKCGGCVYLGMSYAEQLRKKEQTVRKLLNGSGIRVHHMTGMEEPWHYRNRANAAFQKKHDGRIVSGFYERGTHHVVPVSSCLVENVSADKIIGTVRELAASFKIRIYNEDTGYGLLRHVMVRTAHATGQILVVLVASSAVFPSGKNFTKALLKAHPEITSIVLNINDLHTSMVLGRRNVILYGRGYIEDILCGKRFRISPNSFYQINSLQTEKLYRTAVRLAGLSGKETVIDAYSGIGTIGITASGSAGKVICVEQNPDAVHDARVNAEKNGVKNIDFVRDDASDFMERASRRGFRADVIFMDPPRSGSTRKFINAAVSVRPSRIVYISCNPETFARDLRIFAERGYRTGEVWPVDMFPWTDSIECVTLLKKSIR